MSAASTDRRAAIADAAIAILGEEGSRAVTHRAVDRRLGLPLGSTGNLFPTRKALIGAAAERLGDGDLEIADYPELGTITIDQATGIIAARMWELCRPERRFLTLARFELQLDVARQSELFEPERDVRGSFVGLVEKLLEAVGAPDPPGDAPAVTAALDGILMNQVMFPAHQVEDLPAAIRAVLGGFVEPGI